jgi:hypothetical protein
MNVPHLRRDATFPGSTPSGDAANLSHLNALKAESEYRAHRPLRRFAVLAVVGVSLVFWAVVLIALSL